MISDYFKRVSQLTPTQNWINNGKRPKIYYSLITGIYHEYLQKWVKEQGIGISRT